MSPQVISNRKVTVYLCIVFIIALFLRVYNLNGSDLWFDEIGTDMFSSGQLNNMSRMSQVSTGTMFHERIKNDPHSFVYYATVYLFSYIFSGGKALRIISVFFSLLSLIVFYCLSRQFFNQRTSLFAFFLLGVSPFHIWYAQEARVYAMACFFALCFVYLLIKALKTNKWVYWITYPVAGFMAILTSYYAVFLVLVSAGLFLHSDYRRHCKKWIVGILVLAGALSFIVPILSNQVGFVKNEFWLPSPTPGMLMFTWMIFDLGYSANFIQYSIGLVLFFLFFGLGFRAHFKVSRFETVWLASLLVIPIVIVYILSKTSVPLYINRQLLIFSPFYYLFIAKGIEWIPSPKEKILALLCITVLTMTVMYNYYRNYMFDHPMRPIFFTGVVPKKNYNDLLKYLEREIEAGDLVATTDIQAHMILFSRIIKNDTQLGFKNYRYLSFPQYFQPFEKRFLQLDMGDHKTIDPASPDLYVFLSKPNGTMQVTDQSLAQFNPKRIWLLTASWFKEGESHGLGINSVNVQNHLAQNYSRDTVQKQDGIYLDLFTKL